MATTVFGQTSWSDQTVAGITDDIWNVRFANETFVAVTGKGRVLTSNDGLSWSVQTLSANTWLLSSVYGNGLWVVVGEGGAIFYSADLKNWNSAKAATTNRLNGVAFSGKNFIAVGEGGTILTSPDAQNWTVRTSGVTNYLHGIVAKSAVIYTAGGAGTFLSSTDEGVSWSNFSNNNGSNNTTESYGHMTEGPPLSNGFSTVYMTGTNGYVNGYSSYNSSSRVSGYGFIFGASQKMPGAGTANMRGITYGSGALVSVGENGMIYSSTDGLKWTQRFSGDSPSTVTISTMISVAYAETLQRFVAVGGGGKILVSSAPPSTLVNVATRGTVVPADPLIGGFVVSGAAQKNVLIRAVGPTLAGFGVPTALADPVLTIYDSKNVIVATNSSWGTNANLTSLVAATLRGGFPLTAGSKDCALYLTLAPGSYTAVIRSASNATGTVLFEAYSN